LRYLSLTVKVTKPFVFGVGLAVDDVVALSLSCYACSIFASKIFFCIAFRVLYPWAH
jgi:hypothetical protein